MLGAFFGTGRWLSAVVDPDEFPDGPDDDYSPMPPVVPRIKPHTTIALRGKRVQSIALNADAGVAVALDAEKGFEVWDARDGHKRFIASTRPEYLTAMAFDPGGTRVACGVCRGSIGPGDQGDPSSVVVFDATTGDDITILRKLDGHIKGLALTRDGLSVALDSAEVLRAWNVADGSEAYTVSGPVNRRRGGGYEAVQSGFAISANGRRAASLSTDAPLSTDAAVEGEVHPEHTVNLWDADQKTCRVLNAKSGPLRAVALSPDGSRAVLATVRKQIIGFDFMSCRTNFSFSPGVVLGGEGPYLLSFSPDGSRFVIGKKDGVLQVYDSEKGRHIRMFRGPRTYIRAVAFFPDKLRVVSGGYKETGSVKHPNGYVGLKYEPLWVWDAA